LNVSWFQLPESFNVLLVGFARYFQAFSTHIATDVDEVLAFYA
jgi:hypothetical protein